MTSLCRTHGQGHKESPLQLTVANPTLGVLKRAQSTRGSHTHIALDMCPYLAARPYFDITLMIWLTVQWWLRTEIICKRWPADRFRCTTFWFGIFQFHFLWVNPYMRHDPDRLRQWKAKSVCSFWISIVYYSKVSAMCIKKRDVCVTICLKRECSQD